MFKIKLHTIQRCLDGTSKSCVCQGPRERTPTRDWASPACKGLRVSCRGNGQQWPAAGTEALTAALLGSSVSAMSPLGGVTISPTRAPPVGDPETREQLCLRSSWTVAKLLGPTTDFQTWESGKRTETWLEGIWLWRTGIFDYRTSIGKFWNTDSWRAQTKPGVHQDPRERSSDPTRDWATLAF